MSEKNTPDKFWSRVARAKENECWEWQGACTSSGYGNVSWHGQNVQAHRVAFYLHNGGIALQTGFRRKNAARRYKQFVLHKCDNRKCCNPSHLFLGSMKTNLQDAYDKGRKKQPRSGHVNAKLSPAQVCDIRTRYAEGELQKVLAAEHGVSQRAVSLVVRNETYKDIECN